MSFRWAPPLAWNYHMILCTQHWFCTLTGERVKVALNQRERGRRSLINDHMLWEISSRQIRWLSSTWRKSTDPVRTSLTARYINICLLFLVRMNVGSHFRHKSGKASTLMLCLEILTFFFFFLNSAAIVWFFCNVALTPYTKSLFNKENRVIFEFMPVFASTSVTVKR